MGRENPRPERSAKDCAFSRYSGQWEESGGPLGTKWGIAARLYTFGRVLCSASNRYFVVDGPVRSCEYRHVYADRRSGMTTEHVFWANCGE